MDTLQSHRFSATLETESVETSLKSGIQRVQTLADISRSGLWCHSNETRAPIATPPNSAQLDGTPYHSLELHPGPCSSVVMRRGTNRQTQTDTDVRDQYTCRVSYALREMSLGIERVQACTRCTFRVRIMLP